MVYLQSVINGSFSSTHEFKCQKPYSHFILVLNVKQLQSHFHGGKDDCSGSLAHMI